VGWIADLLRRDGATVVVEPWSFPRWDATWRAELNGQEIESCPRYYSCIGTFGPDQIDVVATPHTGGLLEAKNVRVPTGPIDVTARPVMQVPGMFAGREADVRCSIVSAQIIEGHSANVLASWGGAFADADIVIGTPISGWFACASERASGIAVARWISRSLAEQGHRVALVATSGHELFNLGLTHHLATHEMPRGVIVHIGASVGACRFGGGADELSDMVFLTANRAIESGALVDVGFRARSAGADPAEWIGEATQWCTTGRPLLS
jgi:hypothetical protein